jgi:hypothetical protein
MAEKAGVVEPEETKVMFSESWSEGSVLLKLGVSAGT